MIIIYCGVIFKNRPYLYNLREIAKLCLPNAKISADPFHVVKNLTECFTKIRIAVMNKYVHLKKEKTTYYWLYKKYWKFLLKDKSKLPNGSIKVNKYLSSLKLNKYSI